MWRWIIRATVSLAVVGILLSIIPLRSILQSIGRVSVWTWLASLVVFFVGHYFNAVKLRLLIGPESVSLLSCVRAQFAGLVANLGLPGLAGGDLVRATYLVPVAGAKRVAVASIADRVLDTLTMFVFVAAAAPVAGVPSALRERFSTDGPVLVTSFLVGTVAMAVVLALAARRFSHTLADALITIRARRQAILGVVAISLAIQASFVLTNAWLAREVGVTTGLAAWFVAWPLSKLIAVLPISLGGIGVREAALVSFLVPYGAPSDAVVASGILWQTILTVSGLIGLIATQWIWRPAAGATVIPKANA